jgi:signal transduction histidine kinase
MQRSIVPRNGGTVGGLVDRPDQLGNIVETVSRVRGEAWAGARVDDQALRALLGEIVRSTDVAAAGIHVLDQGRANIELTVAVQYPEPFVERYRLIPLAANLPLVDTVKNVTPTFITGLADYLATYPGFAKAHPSTAERAFVALPLVLDGRCVGALSLGFDSARTFTASERDALSGLAHRCSAELERLHRLDADQAARRRAELASQRLERLQAFTGTLAQAITPAQVVETVTELGLAATTARTIALWLQSPDGSSIVLARKLGPQGPAKEEGVRIPIDAPCRVPVMDAVREGVPVWIESRSQLDERYPILPEQFPRHGKEAFACVPLLVQGRRIGALTYGFEGTHPFLEDERAFLQVITWYSAQALERANIYAAEKGAKERAEGSQRRSELVSDIAVLLASSFDDSNILSEVARAAVPRFADWCVLELADHRLRGTPPVATHSDPAKAALVMEMRLRLREMRGFSQGIAAVMSSGISQHHPALTPEMIAASVGGDSPLVKLSQEVGVTSVVVVPISARGQVLGAILLGRGAPPRSFDEQDLAVAEDLGRRIGLAVDNARLYREARDANRLKDEFLAMLGHELRNPLAPIVAALDLMDRNGEPHLAAEREMISRHVRHLVRLLDDLLDVARTTHGKVQLVTERCQLASIIAAAVEVASPLAAQRAHRLTVAAPPADLQVIADHARLTQALANLVTNAAKYTPPGGEIVVSARADGDEAVVSVRDSGVGIAPALLSRVFDLFVQGASGLDRSPGGLGIGLTVAKSVVHLHGGTLSAHSDGVGCGSEFVVRLPRVELVVPVPVVAPAAAPPRASADGYRVLAVDDNRDVAEMLGKALESLGCSAMVAHDGVAALAQAAAFKPQLVLLDIGLPGLDGYEVARRLREAHPDRALRIVAVTGYGQPSDRMRSRVAGFDDHIVKPVRVDVLQRVLDEGR